MTALQKRKLISAMLLALFIVIIILVIGLFKINAPDKNYLAHQFEFKESIVYWGEHKLVTPTQEYTYEERILNYKDGIVETESSYYKGETKVSKSNLKSISKDFYLTINDDVYTWEGKFVKHVEDVDYIISEGSNPVYIKGDTLWGNKKVYLGGKILQLIETTDKVYMINDFSHSSGKAAYIVYNKESQLIEDLFQVEASDLLWQVVDQKIYFLSKNGDWYYQDNKKYTMASQEEIRIYFMSCYVTYEEDELIFKQLNNHSELGRQKVDFLVKGVTAL